MVSPYGQYFLSMGKRSASLESRGSTIIDAVFDASPKNVFDQGLGSRPGHIAKRISSAKAKWNKERMNDLATMHRQILVRTIFVISKALNLKSYFDSKSTPIGSGSERRIESTEF